MFNTIALDRLSREMTVAKEQAPHKYRQFQKAVASRAFKLLDEAAPRNDEGRLRASLNRQPDPHTGGKEWIETYKKDELEVGTQVYYAPMVNDGHVIGVREKKHNHRKSHWKLRRSGLGSYKVRKGWADGCFFREAAQDKLEAELPKMCEDFLAGLFE